MVRLRGNDDFRLFLGMLGEHAASKNQMLIMKDDANVDLIRGELRGFAQLQNTFDGAPALVEKFKQSKEHANGTP